MATGTIGSLAAFDAQAQTWEEYSEVLEQFFVANGIEDEDDDRIQRRLLSEANLTFETAFKIAVANEAASKNVLDLQSKSSVQACNSVMYKERKPDRWKKGEMSHIARACRNKSKQSGPTITGRSGKGVRPHRAFNVSDNNDSDEFEETFTLACVQTDALKKVKPLTVELIVNGRLINFEIDTGCSVSLMSEEMYKVIWKDSEAPKLRLTKIKLRTYTGEPLGIVGVADVEVKYQQQEKIMPLVIVKGTGPCLLGRSWLEELQMQWSEIKLVQSEMTLQQVLFQHAEVFKEELGTLRVEEEINRLLRDKIISPVKYSEWAAPVVPILKPDGSVRLCGDYKLTVNRVSTLEQYPIPRVEDLFARLEGGKQFTKLDMSHAYQQIIMEENSKKYLTVNTQKGLFTYNRLPFGVASAPAIFQRTMEGLLQGIQGVVVYLDDILVTGVNQESHLKTLDEVLARLKEAGLRLKRGKCMFLADEVEYLGHRVDAQGLHPMAIKVKAIEEAPEPSNVAELKAYLGLLNYYNKFLPNLATLLAPLHLLLRKEVPWMWKKPQQEAFKDSKSLLKSAEVLVHYSSDSELVLACDASPYGVGAVLSQRRKGESMEKPLGFMSRTLTSAEKRYSQLDKEGLAVIFGIQRFHKYLYGRAFTICTDHKPLIHLFNETKAVPQMGSPRVQRWAVMLQAYQYNIVYKPGKYHQNADALSRLPAPGEGEPDDTNDQVLMMDLMDDSPVSAAQIRKWTSHDITLSVVHEYILKGWPEKVEPQVLPYHHRRDALSVKDGCVTWGARIIIPSQGRAAILKQLHQAHTGMSRMKGLARSYMWWPGMDQDVERVVQNCEVCQRFRKAPAQAPLHPWEWPSSPWERLHVDYAGPFLERMFLILVDSHSKWMEVYPVTHATSRITIEKLRMCFSTHGLPKMLVSDNGTCFTSNEFEMFMKNNGIHHVTSAPYHPSSNGLAERAVQTFKEGMKKMKGDTVETRVARFLFNYRITPHATSGLSPAQMLMSRKLRSTFDLLIPDMQSKILKKQQKQKESHDKSCKLRSFEVGDSVYVRNYGGGTKWIPAVVECCTGPLSYKTVLGHGLTVKRHVDQIRKRCTDEMLETALPTENEQDGDTSTLSSEDVANAPADVTNASAEQERALLEGGPSIEVTVVEKETNQPIHLRRSARERRAPAYLKDYVT
ncbi:retrotransposable element [Pimephales promelas]|nr:retrotransposable element [Pimephales promelas]